MFENVTNCGKKIATAFSFNNSIAKTLFYCMKKGVITRGTADDLKFSLIPWISEYRY